MAHRPGTAYTVINGPSKLTLMLALFDIEMGVREPIFVTQDSQITKKFRVTISTVTRLRQGDWWILLGTAVNDDDVCEVKIVYDSDTRHGYLTIMEKGSLFVKDTTPDDNRRARVLMTLIHRIITRYQDRHDGNLDNEIFRQYEFAKRVRDAETEEALTRAIEELSPKD